MNGGSGRCLCRAVRYAFAGEPVSQSHCHCESCRRATASGFTSFLTVRNDTLTWRGTLSAFASSPGVTRRFCPVCGSQMSYQSTDRQDETDLYAATLDDPESFAPTEHDFWNEHLPWIDPADGLPRLRAPERLGPDDDLGAVLDLIRRCFAGMDGRVDPPSSVHRLTIGDLADTAATGEVWVMREGAMPVACMVLTYRENSVYLGKLAVDATSRRQGIARQMIDHGVTRTKAAGRPVLELQTRIELTENQAVFRALGFEAAGTTSHPGYDRPTSVTFQRRVV